jgi:hypothetical protein
MAQRQLLGSCEGSFLLSSTEQLRCFHDLLRQKSSSLFMLLWWNSTVPLMIRSMYLGLMMRILVLWSCTWCPMLILCPAQLTCLPRHGVNWMACPSKTDFTVFTAFMQDKCSWRAFSGKIATVTGGFPGPLILLLKFPCPMTSQIQSLSCLMTFTSHC